MDCRRLANRVAVVTGGGSGLGAEMCRAFAREGAKVAVADVRPDAAQETVASIRDAGGEALAVAIDVSERAAVEGAADEVIQRFGELGIWVNNAGISRVVPFLECSDEVWDTTMRINLKGSFIGCQVAIRHMLPRRHGVILNMSSQSGKVGNSAYAAYCASKFGIVGLTQSLAIEFAREGIRVNALCPGVVFTPLWEAQLPDYARKRNLRQEDVRPYIEDRIPMGRACTPQDVAQAAVFLVSDESAYMTGQAINLAGGSVMH
jgi:NAD(P)-dependent dehydrogenase (short-subunit alcohol dehydrogenase family)